MTNPGLRILPAPQRAPKALLARVRRIPTPHISDCMNRLSVAGVAIRPSHARAAGRWVTVRTAYNAT